MMPEGFMLQSAWHRPEVLEARLTAFERDADLYAADNLAARARALDTIQQVYQLLHLHRQHAPWGRYRSTLWHQAKGLEQRLRTVDAALFDTLRQQIRTGAWSAAALRRYVDTHTRYRPGRPGQIHRGYDTLDALIQGLIQAEQAPTAAPRHDIDMIPYEPTPARAVLDLVDQVRLSVDDLFYDIGAGLGHVVILVHLLTGVAARGVEIEAAYCRHAQDAADALDLSNVRFLNCDACEADYADGTVFFLYTPLTGKLIDTMLATLARQARQRPITVCTFGACTFEVARQPWLRLRHPEAEQAYALAVFESL